MSWTLFKRYPGTVWNDLCTNIPIKRVAKRSKYIFYYSLFCRYFVVETKQELSKSEFLKLYIKLLWLFTSNWETAKLFIFCIVVDTAVCRVFLANTRLPWDKVILSRILIVKTDPLAYFSIKGSLTRDFQLQVFFHKSVSTGPWVPL